MGSGELHPDSRTGSLHRKAYLRITPSAYTTFHPGWALQAVKLKTQPHSSQGIGDMGGGTVEVAGGGNALVDQVVSRCQVEGYVTTGLKYL